MAASKAKVSDLLKQGDSLFTKRVGLLSLWDELALNYYPERADFQSPHTFGDDFADHLRDGAPVRFRAELASALSAMLRPRGRQWFRRSSGDEPTDERPVNAKFLEVQSERLSRLMYAPKAQFVRATREGDNDYVTFGQAVLSVEESTARDHMLFRDWHIRDCVWMENADGVIDRLDRDFKLTARAAVQRWGKKNLHRDIVKAAEQEPGKEFEFRHVCMPTEEYADGAERKRMKLPHMSVYLDRVHNECIYEGGLPGFTYIVPRWATVSGSVYAFAPPAIIALPDARFLQELTWTMIEAGQKHVDPAALAISEAIRSDIDMSAGGITWVDAKYDERTGEPLRYLEQRGNFNVALDFQANKYESLSSAWFINKLNLPQDREMTAYEVSERVKEFLRGSLPLFEPMETDYNAQLLEKSYLVADNAGAFDDLEVPPDLQGADMRFEFESPIQEAQKRIHVAQFSEALGLVASAAELAGEEFRPPISIDKSLEDAIQGTGAPADWFLDDEQKAQAAEQAANAQAMREAGAAVREGVTLAGDVADTTTALREAGLSE